MNKENCKNCGAIAEGNFCANCGQKTQLQRLSFATLVKELSDNIFQVNHGLFYSIIEFTYRPAESIENYLASKRKQYFQPIAYAFTLASLYYLLSQLIEHKTFFGFAIEGYKAGSSDTVKDKTVIGYFDWFARNYAVSALLLVPIFSLATFLVFLNEKRNYLEHVVLNLYITGHQALIYALFSIVGLAIESEDIVVNLTLISSMGYAIYVLTSFFSKQRILIRILKIVISYIVYIVLFLLLLIPLMLLSGI